MASRGQYRGGHGGRRFSRGSQDRGARGFRDPYRGGGEHSGHSAQSTTSFNLENLCRMLQQANNTVSNLTSRLDKLENRGPDNKSGKPNRAAEISAGPFPTYYNNRSSNPCFADVCKSIYRIVQLQHHMDNWKTLPKSIQDRMDKLVRDVNPPMTNDTFKILLGEATEQYKEKMIQLVQQHLQSNFIQKVADAGRLSRVDIERATDVASKYLQTRLGRRLDANKRLSLLKTAADAVGQVYQPPPPLPAMLQVQDPPSSPPLANMEDEWHLVASPRTSTSCKRKAEDNISSTPTSNRFQMLQEEEEDEEEDHEPQLNSEPTAPPPVQHSAKKVRKATRFFISHTQDPTCEPAFPAPPVQRSPDRMNITRVSIPMPGTQQPDPSSPTPSIHNPVISNPNHRRTSTSYIQKVTVSQRGVEIFHGPLDKWIIKPSPSTHTLVIGDANLRHVHGIPDGWEIHYAPDATIQDIYKTVSNSFSLEESREYNVIIQAGINNRNETETYTARIINFFCGYLYRAKAISNFMHLGVSTAKSMSEKHIQAINMVNQTFITAITEKNCIPPLDPDDVTISETDPQGMLYTEETTDRIFSAVFNKYGLTF